MDLDILTRTFLYFLALINPASKIFLLSTHQPVFDQKNLQAVAVRSTFVAFIILSLLALAGNFILVQVFQVNIYSLRIAGSVVLFLVGLSAVRHGRFYEESSLKSTPDISVVPLAAPLIAGPGTITAAISYAALYGFWFTIICLSAALLVNLIAMLAARRIGSVLDKINAIGPLVRISGLIVMAVAVQMLLTGLEDWIRGFVSSGLHSIP
jgi:multiple antibiotic resistance protein